METRAEIRKRMESVNLHEDVIADFLHRVELIQRGYNGKIPWNKIGDLDQKDYARLEELPTSPDLSGDLSKLVIIKLNGGLGTSMGLSRAKSIIPVRGEYSFLELIKTQIEKLREKYSAPVPLIFMNSFNTREDTLALKGIKEFNESAPGAPAPDFLQNMAPRLQSKDLKPLGDGSSREHWCPPGHGDIYLSLKISGLLDKLLSAGYRAAFISNGDNLGATFDDRILTLLFADKLDFISEVTPKTKADLKGGVLYRPLNEAGQPGAIELLETAQVEDGHIKDFQDINRFAYFNINNLWVNLESLRDRLRQGDFHLSLIRNPKKVLEQDILQLETAMGSAIGRFDNTRVVIVPRTRFAPVKNCADLLVRRSDAYTLVTSDGSLIQNPERKLGEPVVLLDDNYKKLEDFNRLFAAAPSLIDCEVLEVSGPVLFDIPIKLKGKVTLKNPTNKPRPVSTLGRSEFADEVVEFSS